LELRASDISLDAQRAEKQAEQTMWKLRKEVYTPESILALQHYVTHLKDANGRITDRARKLQAELESHEEYSHSESSQDEDDGRSSRDVPTLYRDVGKRVEEAKRDMDRLRLS
jgi:hypothetical protein